MTKLALGMSMPGWQSWLWTCQCMDDKAGFGYVNDWMPKLASGLSITGWQKWIWTCQCLDDKAELSWLWVYECLNDKAGFGYVNAWMTHLALNLSMTSFVVSHKEDIDSDTLLVAVTIHTKIKQGNVCNNILCMICIVLHVHVQCTELHINYEKDVKSVRSC